MNRRLSWAALVVVVVVALGVGVVEERAPRTEVDRVTAIAAGIRCPTCAGLSAAESDAAAAQAVRDEIRTRLREGQGRAEIEAYFVSRFGRGILLEPERSGVAGLVWVLPVGGALLAIGLVTSMFLRRARHRDGAATTPADRALVERALGRP